MGAPGLNIGRKGTQLLFQAPAGRNMGKNFLHIPPHWGLGLFDGYISINITPRWAVKRPGFQQNSELKPGFQNRG